VLAGLVWGAFVAAVAVGVASLMDVSQLPAILGSPGLWVPLGLLAAGLAAVLLVRRAFGRERLVLQAHPPAVRWAPSRLRTVASGLAPRVQPFETLDRVRRLPGPDGVRLALVGQSTALLDGEPPDHEPLDGEPLGDEPPAPLVLRLQHPQAPRVVQALLQAAPPGALSPGLRAELQRFPADAAAALGGEAEAGVHLGAGARAGTETGAGAGAGAGTGAGTGTGTGTDAGADASGSSATPTDAGFDSGANRDAMAGAEPFLRYCVTAGLWQLAAERLWPRVLADPDDRDLALALYRVERQRLPSAARLRLARALWARHPGQDRLALEVARLSLVFRLREDALTALDSLAAPASISASVSSSGSGPGSSPSADPDTEPVPDVEPAPPAAAVSAAVAEAAPAVEVARFWRRQLRGRRALPVPGSKPTFGIEVNLPDHRLEGSTLVVQDRFRAELLWFVGYRLLPGFWGPPRALELLDLWGGRHLLRGDPWSWAARLVAAAPHLSPLHDEGLIWPPVGRRIRRLAPARREPGPG
jgi:hypothetical protein